MQKTNVLTFLLILVSTFQLMGQSSYDLGVSNSGMMSSGEKLPLWLWANRDGKIANDTSLLNLSELSLSGKHNFNENTFVSGGVGLAGGLSPAGNYFQTNTIYAGISIRDWELLAGRYYDPVEFEGLSTTNGNMARSRNARPHPRIGLRINTYKSFPFFQSFLRFKASYEEGLLDDERHVDKARLHHKSLYFRFLPSELTTIDLGLEHFVMWGGTSSSENIGQLPQSFSDYLRYITGKSGSENFLETDQINVAGNQYGTWQIKVSRTFEDFVLQLNISHPFEDMSGLRFENYPDNLIGIDLKFKEENKLISHILYEYIHTSQQSLWQDSTHLYDEGIGRWRAYHVDKYYTHGIYKSGATYEGKMMASPLFFPVKIVDGISRGPASTRYIAHHLGIKGQLAPQFHWMAKTTFITHKGNYSAPLDPEHRQTSLLLQLAYHPQNIPLQLKAVFAGDFGNTIENMTAFELSISYYLRKENSKHHSKGPHLPFAR
ncbi:capsule assembly Wzi family protein [uncultured Draconibacterium sp.]|uniref:capsule assembly Wzi family protein n=1 Tax=uncultured Draconibacterium sp. TaxID=1573823 RepID=UPI0025F9487D|nr:capsule assembly Wzi family protein [uncultured Draconibacterium sp.]